MLAPHPRNARRLQQWITDARATDLPHVHAFTRGLDLDSQAATAALTLPHHNGRTEGVNTKTKMIKRQMYGRAGFTLLRHRILLGLRYKPSPPKVRQSPGNGVMAFDLQRPLDGTAPSRSILEAHHRTALGPAADQPETSGHHGDPHVVQRLQVRAHDTVLAPHKGCRGGMGHDEHCA